MKILLALLTVFGVSQGLAKTGACQENYIPEHTEDDLMETKAWAAGGAFRIHAKNAGYFFDGKAYIGDIPSLEIFNFGKVIGPVCWDYYINVTDSFTSYLSVLDKYWAEHQNPDDDSQQSFQEYFDEKATTLGFDKYLSPLESETHLL